MARPVLVAGVLGAIAIGAYLWLQDGSKPAGDGATTNTVDRPPAVAPVRERAAPGDLFEDVTAASGIRFRHRLADGRLDDVVESIGSGATWFDYDGDGFLDLYVLQHAARPGTEPADAPAERPSDRLFRNRGDGTFEDVTRQTGVGDVGFGFSAAAVDYDNDGDTDLFVFNDGPNRLYRNGGDGTFDEIGELAGLTGPACSVSGTFFDYDGDGFLDLYVTNYLTLDPDYHLHYAPDVFPGPLAFAAQDDALYRNRGDGKFEDVTAAMGLDVVPGRGMGVVAADFDEDGKADVFVANDASANFLLKNLGGGRFREIGLEAGVAFGFHGEATGAMAGSVGDFDDDGRPDIHVTDTKYGSLYHNRGGGRFQDRSLGAGIASISGQWVSWGGGFLDFDNDGDLDLYLANGDLHHPTGRPDLLFENTGDRKFVDVSRTGGAYFRRELLSRGGLIGDYDNDGWIDVLITNLDGEPVLLKNRGVSGHHWITLDLRAVKGNRNAFGARVTVTAGGRTRVRTVHHDIAYLTQPDPRLHFGLGTVEQIDDVRVRWASGREERFDGLAIDGIHRLVEGEGKP